MAPSSSELLKQEALQAWQETVSSDLNALTPQERSGALDDLHCVGEEDGTLDETLSTMLLDEFDRLAREERNPLFEKAERQNHAYITDPSFRLRFLKSNSLSVKQSVRQMMTYLQYKAAYFGEEKVAHEFTLEDLNEEDKEALYSGLFHIQKDRDRAGRLVIYIMAHMLGQWKLETLIRVAHCIWSSIVLPDATTDTKGVKLVIYEGSSSQGNSPKIPDCNFISSLVNALFSFPLRYSAAHVCLKASSTLTFGRETFKEAINLIPRYTRVRTRIHFGTDQEHQQTLRGHGLCIESFPLDVDGNVRTEILNEWIFDHTCGSQAAAALKRGSSTSCSEDDSSLDVSGGSGRAPRKTDRDLMLPFNDSEDGKTSPSTAESKEDGGLPPAARAPIVPTKRDVLLGRGWKLQNHDGNVIFRQFLEDYAEAYDRSPRLEKRKMARTLVLSMKRDGTRFLKQSEENSDIWMDSTMLEAENKVSQVFRTIRKNRQPKSGTVGV